MMTLTRKTVVRASPDQVFRLCASREGFCDQFPFRVIWDSGPEHWKKGDVLDFRYRAFGIWFRHRAEVVEFEQDRMFTDCMTKGLYRAFRHTHRFEPCHGGTQVIDTVEFTLGMGRFVDRIFGMPSLAYAFRKRHQAIRSLWSK